VEYLYKIHTSVTKLQKNMSITYHFPPQRTLGNVEDDRPLLIRLARIAEQFYELPKLVPRSNDPKGYYRAALQGKLIEIWDRFEQDYKFEFGNALRLLYRVDNGKELLFELDCMKYIRTPKNLYEAHFYRDTDQKNLLQIVNMQWEKGSTNIENAHIFWVPKKQSLGRRLKSKHTGYYLLALTALVELLEEWLSAQQGENASEIPFADYHFSAFRTDYPFAEATPRPLMMQCLRCKKRILSLQPSKS
jgi:hypothetical protein